MKWAKLTVLALAGFGLVTACAARDPVGGSGGETSATEAQALSSSAGLQLKTLTNSCATTEVQQFFEVANTGPSSVKASDITIKFWVDDTTGKNFSTHVNGGCLSTANGACTHQVQGVALNAARISPACGPDPTHQANWEVTISNTDSTALAPGLTWTNLQTHLMLPNGSTFTPGTSDWYSPCLTGTSYAYDTHFAVYVGGNLVTGSPGVPPSCRAPHGSMPVAGETPPGLGTTYPLVGPLPGSTQVSLAIGLPLVNQSGLQDLIQQVSDPTSQTYRQYLSPDQFAAAYGPSQADYAALTSFATSNGLAVSSTFTSRDLLAVTGTAAAVENAFFVTLNVYRRPDGTTFYAPANDPSLNLSLGNPVLHISGLDTLATPIPAGGTSSQHCPVGGGAGGWYWNDLRQQYVGLCGGNPSAPACSDFGQGQTVALLELDSYDPQNITTFANGTNLGTPLTTQSPNFPTNIKQVVVAGSGSAGAAIPFSPPGFTPELAVAQSEAELGIEMVLAMAPQANIVVYEQDTTNLTSIHPVPIFAQMAENAPGTSSPPQVVNNSWTWPSSVSDLNLPQIFEQYAAQGQSLFQASGDFGAYLAGGAVTSVPEPISDSSLMTVVGGTTFAGALNQEVTWNNPSERTAAACTTLPLSTATLQSTNNVTCNSVSGGGICSGLPIPSYQAGINNGNPDTNGVTHRMIPDVSILADNLATVTRFGPPSNPAYGSASPRVATCSAGTTASAALWAGLAALANEAAAAGGKPPIGFANPRLYFLASSPGPFNDVVAGTNGLPANDSNNNYSGSGQYSATGGYDLATGLGSPTASSSSLVSGLPAQSCMTGASVTALVRGQAVTAYVPAGSYDESKPNLFAVPIEEPWTGATHTYPTPLATAAPPVTIGTPAPGSDPLGATINTCAGDSQTGKIVCTSDGVTVWLIDGTLALGSQTASPLTDGATTTENFSGGTCETCNVTVDPVHGTGAGIAYLSIGTASGAAFQSLDLRTNTLGTPIATGQQATSEDIVVDPIRNLLLSPNEGGQEPAASGSMFGVGDFQVVNTSTNAVSDFLPPNPPSLHNGSGPVVAEFDSAGEDCTTGIALATDEFSSSLFMADLNQRGSWASGTGFQFFPIPEFANLTSDESGISAVAVVSDEHVGAISGEYTGGTFAAIVLPTNAPPAGSAPALQDYVVAILPSTPDGQAWAFGHDPHTLTAYKSPNSGKPYAVFEDDVTQDGTRTFLAVVDLGALLGRPRSSTNSHMLATDLVSGTDTCIDIDPTTGVNPAGCIVRFVGSASGL